MIKDTGEQAKPLTDTALEDVEGGVYVQEFPSGAKTQRQKGDALQRDKPDAVAPPGTPWVVFEPNDEP